MSERVSARPQLEALAVAAVSLLTLGPHRLVVFWKCAGVHVERTRHALGDSCAVIVIRVHDCTLIEYDDRRSLASFDIEVRSESGNYYLNDLFSGRSYRVEFGLRAADGRFRVLGSSAVAETPAEQPVVRRAGHVATVNGSSRSRWRPRTVASETLPAVPVADASTSVVEGPSFAPLPAARHGSLRDVDHDPDRDAQARTSDVVLAVEGAAALAGAVHAESRDPSLVALAVPAASVGPIVPPAEHSKSLPSSMTHVVERGPVTGDSSLGLTRLVEIVSTGGEADSGAAIPGEDGGAPRLELHADLVVYGRTDPGVPLYVDGVRIAVREDGTFDARFVLGSGSVAAKSAEGT